MAAEARGDAAERGVRTEETHQKFGVQFSAVRAGRPFAACGELIVREVESQGVRRVAHADLDPESWFSVAHAGNDLRRADVSSIQRQGNPGTVRCEIPLTSTPCLNGDVPRCASLGVPRSKCRRRQGIDSKSASSLRIPSRCSPTHVNEAFGDRLFDR